MASDRTQRGYATASDVAAEVGVSPATVSLVVNGRAAGRVSLATQRKVHAAVAKLGYRVDAFARGLATGRRGAIALVTPDIADPFFSQVAMGVARGLRGRYQLVLVATGDPAVVTPPVVDDLSSMRVDGVLVESTAAELLDGDHAPWPIVVLDAPGHEGDWGRVEFDISHGAKALADHLWLLGHRRLGYLDWSGDSPTFRARRAALLGAWRELGGESRTAKSRIEIEDAEAAFLRAWRSWSRSVSVVVGATDQQAYGVLKAAHESSVRVPLDISVAGFNDLAFSQISDPPLTTVALPAVELGDRAARLLCGLIDATEPQEQVVIGTHLVARASTSKARP